MAPSPSSRIDIALSRVVYRFDATRALGPISLSVRHGERIALLGTSGAGKSTLLKLIAGLIKPHAGTITVAGTPVTGPMPRATLMLQRPALLPWASVADNVALGLRFSGLERRDPALARRRVAELLEQVGLADRAGARPHELSGGQQQRVALARALAPLPELLLLDEPFSALDLGTREALRRDVARMAHERGTTVVLVTHDINDALALSDRAIVLGGNPARLQADMSVGTEGIEYLTEALRAS